MIPRGFSAEKGWRCELGELLACSTEAAKRCWLFHGLWDRESRSRHRRLHPPCLRAPWGARLAPPARRLTGAAPRTQDGGARVPGLGGPLGQRAVAAEEAAPARPPHPAAGAGRPGGEPQGDGGRCNLHYRDVNNDGLLEAEWLQWYSLRQGDPDVLWLRGKGRKGAQGEWGWEDTVTPEKLNFKQSEQTPEEVS